MDTSLTCVALSQRCRAGGEGCQPRRWNCDPVLLHAIGQECRVCAHKVDEDVPRRHRLERSVKLDLTSSGPTDTDAIRILAEYSVHALEWLLASLLEDNDEVIVFRVIEPGSPAHTQWRQGAAGMEEQREEAESVLEDIMRKNGERKKISIIVEFAVGPIEETIHRMIVSRPIPRRPLVRPTD